MASIVIHEFQLLCYQADLTIHGLFPPIKVTVIQEECPERGLTARSFIGAIMIPGLVDEFAGKFQRPTLDDFLGIGMSSVSCFMKQTMGPVDIGFRTYAM